MDADIKSRTANLYGKLVDTISINYLEKDDGYSSTTLKVKNDSIGLNHFENLLIENYPDGTTSIKLLKYNLTKPFELIITQNELESNISSTEVSIYNNSTYSYTTMGCIEVGYYIDVDACGGELVTPGERPECFNEDGSRARRTIFITLANDCGQSGGGGVNIIGGGSGNSSGGNTSGGTVGNSGSGGSYSGAGIFVPNLYSGVEDPTNTDFILAGEVGIFFNNLPQNLQNLANGNVWVYAYTVDYFRNVRGGVSQTNKDHVEDALSNFEYFKNNYYRINRSRINNERITFWAYYNLLNSGVLNPQDNSQDIFDIGNFLLNVNESFEDLTITYLFENFDSNEEVEFMIDMIEFYEEADWKDLLRDAIADGITSTAELVHKIYKKLSEIAQEYPSSIGYINIVVDEFMDIAGEAFDTNPNTADWFDLFGIWLFELGDYPQNIINFDGDDTTTESLKQQEGVNEARQEALDKIANNDLSDPNVYHPWTYGQGEFYDGMANGNIATSFLGSYGTNITITQNLNGSYTLTFTVSNPSTWQSATRLRIDNDNDGHHDGIFPNKNRGDGIHLGGTIEQTWIWTEIVN